MPVTCHSLLQRALGFPYTRHISPYPPRPLPLPPPLPFPTPIPKRIVGDSRP